MLAAKSIVYVKQGASGLYFISVCERLGIAEQVKAKAKILPGGRVAELNAPLMKAKGMEPGWTSIGPAAIPNSNSLISRHNSLITAKNSLFDGVGCRS
jgi:hypothetical protein